MDVNLPEVVAEVSACFSRYEAALATNDLKTLDELFWADPLVVRFGADGNYFGDREIHTYRRNRPTDDLARELGRLVLTTFGTDFATTSAEFRRNGSGTVGRQSQTWVRTSQGWRVVAAHVSHLDR